MAVQTLGPLAEGRSRDELVAAVTSALDHLEAGATVVVACSGGPDSSALAFLTAEARPDVKLVLVHVRHGLRDDARDRDLVVQHAEWLGAPVDVRDVEVVRDGRGIEAAARDARYAALRSAAAEAGASSILVGHTADDQAETVLFRIVRGTGLDGLSAMAPTSGDLTRPLLRIRRADIRRFLDGEGVPFVLDATNDDPEIRRAIIRHEALPALERATPDAVGAIVRLSDLARDDARALDTLVRPLLRDIRWFGELAVIPTATLDAAGPAIGRRLVRAVLGRLTDRPPSAATVQRVLAAGEGTAASLPGRVQVAVARGWCTLRSQVCVDADEVELRLRGTTSWPPAGLAIEAVGIEEAATDGSGQIPLAIPGAARPPAAHVDARVVPPGGDAERCTLLLPGDVGRLTIRHAATGERVRTAAGTRTVADVLGEAGMPRLLRRRWPVVAVGTRAVWVPGIAADDELLRAGRLSPTWQLVLRRGT